MEDYTNWHKRLSWRVKRGYLEVNTILIAFLKANHLDPESVLKTDASKREKFENLLNQYSDQTLFNYLVKLEFDDQNQAIVKYCHHIVHIAAHYLAHHPQSTI